MICERALSLPQPPSPFFELASEEKRPPENKEDSQVSEQNSGVIFVAKAEAA
jgi:hypothetical protein